MKLEASEFVDPLLSLLGPVMTRAVSEHGRGQTKLETSRLVDRLLLPRGPAENRNGPIRSGPVMKLEGFKADRSCPPGMIKDMATTRPERAMKLECEGGRPVMGMTKAMATRGQG